jgi:hypothetical protein
MPFPQRVQSMTLGGPAQSGTRVSPSQHPEQMSFASNQSPSLVHAPLIPPYRKQVPLAVPSQQLVPASGRQQRYTPSVPVVVYPG